MLKFFSELSINTNNNAKPATNEEIELNIPIAKRYVTNYPSVSRTSINRSSFCPTPDEYFRQQLANLNSEQVEESKPRTSVGMNSK